MQPKRNLLLSFVLYVIFVMVLIPTFADSAFLDLETYALGSVNGQDGWSQTGAAFDVEVVDQAALSLSYPGFGSRSLRISNAVISGSFSDQTFTKSLVDEAGESTALNGGFSGGQRQNYFEAEWEFASVDPNNEQSGLSVVVSPNRGDTARMSWVQMADTSSGLEVNFYGYDTTLGNSCGSGLNFVFLPAASGLDRTVSHTIKLTMTFLDGINNDIVELYVDGELKITHNSWEDYFRDCEPPESRTVDSLLFRVSGTAAPATSGKGFLIDNISLSSRVVPEVVTAGNIGVDWAFTNQAGAGAIEFVEGPDTPPWGAGSLQMSTTGSGDKATFFNYDYGIFSPSGEGIPLADITTLGYSTYGDSSTLAPTLQMEIDPDGPGTTGVDDYATLNFEPYYSHTIIPNTWQTWDVLTAGAGVWASGFTGPGSISDPVTWATFISLYPDATILYGFGANVGSGWVTSFTGHVDNLSIGTAEFLDIYDMEPTEISLVPEDELLVCGSNEAVSIVLNGVSNLYGYQIELSYDDSLVSATGALENSWFDTTSNAYIVDSTCSGGSCLFAATKTNPGTPLSGAGTVASIELAPLAAGTFNLTIDSVTLSNVDGFEIPVDLPTLPLKVTVCGSAAVSGVVELQGRLTPIDEGDVKLIDNGGNFPAITMQFSAADGTYSFPAVPVLPTGSDYRFEATHLLYLGNELDPVTLNPGDNYNATATRLRGGDADNSGTIDIVDASCIGASFMMVSGPCGLSGDTDINADGITNIQDLALTGGNYSRVTWQAW